MRIISIAAILACLCGVWLARGTQTTVAYQPVAQALVLSFTELPDKWVVESTLDLTNWFSIVYSGEIPPKQLDFVLTNVGHAQFYRVRSLEQ